MITISDETTLDEALTLLGYDHVSSATSHQGRDVSKDGAIVKRGISAGDCWEWLHETKQIYSAYHEERAAIAALARLNALVDEGERVTPEMRRERAELIETLERLAA